MSSSSRRWAAAPSPAWGELHCHLWGFTVLEMPKVPFQSSSTHAHPILIVIVVFYFVFSPFASAWQAFKSGSFFRQRHSLLTR